MLNKTPVTKAKEIKRAWHLIDLEGQVLGRAATQIARHLIGKDKPNLSSHLDTGDYVVAINSDKIVVTGRKLDQKIYYRHSGYPGNLKETTLKDKLSKDSRQVIELAVKGMLPKNKLQTPRLRRLKVFKDATHSYEAQISHKNK